MPDISQVFDRDNPFGRLGEAVRETMAPPVLITVSGVMAAFATIVTAVSLYEITGGLSITEKLILNEAEPAELFAHTVCDERVSKDSKDFSLTDHGPMKPIICIQKKALN